MPAHLLLTAVHWLERGERTLIIRLARGRPNERRAEGFEEHLFLRTRLSYLSIGKDGVGNTGILNHPDVLIGALNLDRVSSQPPC